MTRNFTVIFFTCLLSITLCRHLENTVSDARTIKKTIGIFDGNNSMDSTITATSTNTGKSADNVGTQTQTPQESLGQGQSPVSNQQDDEEMPSPLDLPSTTPTETPALDSSTTSTTAEAFRPASKPDAEETRAIDTMPHALPQTSQQESMVRSDVGVMDTPQDGIGAVGGDVANIPLVNPTEPSTGPATHDDKYASKVKGNGEKVDYEKNHGQQGPLPPSPESTETRMGIDNNRTTNTDLPYVKLDNVNDADSDSSSPIIRPELNHLDNNVDQIKRIEVPPTVTPNSDGASNSLIGKSDADKTLLSSGTQNDQISTNKMAGSSLGATLDDKQEEVNNGESLSAEIAEKENKINSLVEGGVINPVEQIPASEKQNAYEDETMEQFITTTTLTTSNNNEVQDMDVNQLENTDANLDAVNQLESVNPMIDERPSVQAVFEDAGNQLEQKNQVNEIRPTERAVPDETVVESPIGIPDNTINREPDDVDPLDIFVDDIKYQRFPKAMPISVFLEKVSGQTFKKMYILESAEKKLFQHVRQLEVTYILEGDELFAEFLFRFIYSRQCTKIQKFKLGTLAKGSDVAVFEKELEGDKTERLVFFSQLPDDYVFFMSCTDYKESPYACRDTYYVTLDSKHDPPNQFPWLQAASELENEMKLTFQDPRFIFNFVMMPCAAE